MAVVHEGDSREILIKRIEQYLKVLGRGQLLPVILFKPILVYVTYKYNS